MVDVEKVGFSSCLTLDPLVSCYSIIASNFAEVNFSILMKCKTSVFQKRLGFGQHSIMLWQGPWEICNTRA